MILTYVSSDIISENFPQDGQSWAYLPRHFFQFTNGRASKYLNSSESVILLLNFRHIDKHFRGILDFCHNYIHPLCNRKIIDMTLLMVDSPYHRFWYNKCIFATLDMLHRVRQLARPLLSPELEKSDFWQHSYKIIVKKHDYEKQF